MNAPCYKIPHQLCSSFRNEKLQGNIIFERARCGVVFTNLCIIILDESREQSDIELAAQLKVWDRFSRWD